jgi:transcriptional regulator with XRE-family HTH domain
MSNLQNLANAAIEKLRKEKKLSREDMAYHLDISLEAYRKIENGITKLSLDRLEQICEILETDMLKILTTSEAKYQVGEVKDKAIGVNTGTVNHSADKSIETRMAQLEESMQALTLLVHKFIVDDKTKL